MLAELEEIIARAERRRRSMPPPPSPATAGTAGTGREAEANALVPGGARHPDATDAARHRARRVRHGVVSGGAGDVPDRAPASRASASLLVALPDSEVARRYGSAGGEGSQFKCHKVFTPAAALNT